MTIHSLGNDNSLKFNILLFFDSSGFYIQNNDVHDLLHTL